MLRILDSTCVRHALPIEDAIKAVRSAYVCCSEETGIAPERVHIDLPGKGNVALFMPGFVPASGGSSSGSLVVKTVTVFPDNPRRGLPMNQGALLAIDPESGSAFGLLDTASVTALRTAAGSAVATDCLSRADASVLAMLGTGVLAHPHIDAICAVRPIRAIHIWGRTPEHADQLAQSVRPRHSVEVTVHRTAAEAVAGADIVCTATPARTALFESESVRDGTHINAVGSFRPSMCEVPAKLVSRARVFVDQRAACLAEAGDLIQAQQAGLFAWDDVVGEIGEALTQRAVPRESGTDITLFKSVGISLQDAAVTAVALANAERDGIGQLIAWP